MSATTIQSSGNAPHRGTAALAKWERPVIEEVCVALEINDYESCTPDLTSEAIPAKRTR